MTLKERAKELKTNIPALFIALKDPDTPAAAKILAAVTVGYALSPIDLIPDFVPVLGYLDDVIILPSLVLLTTRLIPEEVWSRSRAAAADIWQNGKPKRWYFAIPVVAVWLLVILLIAKKIWF